MALRNSEVVATQSSERRCKSLPSPAHFLFRFCWARGSSAPSPLPSYPEMVELCFLLRSHRGELIWRGDGALSLLFAWRGRWGPEQSPPQSTPSWSAFQAPWNSSMNIFLPLTCLLEPLCGGFRSFNFCSASTFPPGIRHHPRFPCRTILLPSPCWEGEQDSPACFPPVPLGSGSLGDEEVHGAALLL